MYDPTNVQKPQPPQPGRKYLMRLIGFRFGPTKSQPDNNCGYQATFVPVDGRLNFTSVDMDGVHQTNNTIRAIKTFSWPRGGTENVVDPKTDAIAEVVHPKFSADMDRSKMDNSSKRALEFMDDLISIGDYKSLVGSTVQVSDTTLLACNTDWPDKNPCCRLDPEWQVSAGPFDIEGELGEGKMDSMAQMLCSLIGRIYLVQISENRKRGTHEVGQIFDPLTEKARAAGLGALGAQSPDEMIAKIRERQKSRVADILDKTKEKPEVNLAPIPEPPADEDLPSEPDQKAG